jgi:hypothetical protein
MSTTTDLKKALAKIDVEDLRLIVMVAASIMRLGQRLYALLRVADIPPEVWEEAKAKNDKTIDDYIRSLGGDPPPPPDIPGNS